jgi:hypothetical protein
MIKYFLCIIIFLFIFKKIDNSISDENNQICIRKKSTLVKLCGEDYRHFSKGKQAFVVNKWTFKNFDKESMDLFKKRLLNNVCIYKKYHKYENCIKIINKKNPIECFLKKPALSCKEMLRIAQTSDIQLLFSLNYDKGEFLVSYNHGIFDGLTMVKLFQKILNKECQPYEIKNLEFTMKNFLYSLTKIHRIKSNPIIKNLENPKIIKIRLDSRILKKIMEKHNCTFNAAYAFYILKLINLDNVGVGALTPGIIKKKSFNSYGIIPFVYSKKDTPKKINKKIIDNSGTALLSNMFISYSSNYLKKLYKDKIHILLSSIPFCKKPAKIGNMEIDFHSVYMPYHSCPVYVFSGKAENTLNITISIKNEEIYKNINKKLYNEI